MTDVQLSNLRAQLEAERADLLAQLAELGHGGAAADALTYDANFADSSQVTAEKGETEALAATLQETLTAVDAALHRMEVGSYGLCERCQAPIAPARLEAMPSATRCIEHASQP